MSFSSEKTADFLDHGHMFCPHLLGRVLTCVCGCHSELCSKTAISASVPVFSAVLPEDPTIKGIQYWFKACPSRTEILYTGDAEILNVFTIFTLRNIIPKLFHNLQTQFFCRLVNPPFKDTLLKKIVNHNSMNLISWKIFLQLFLFRTTCFFNPGNTFSSNLKWDNIFPEIVKLLSLNFLYVFCLL